MQINKQILRQTGVCWGVDLNRLYMAASIKLELIYLIAEQTANIACGRKFWHAPKNQYSQLHFLLFDDIK